MFNNTNCNTNGELFFYNSIKNNINIIFDVGCKDDSIFLDFNKEVHYFDPNLDNIDSLSSINNNNSKSYFNNFGLSDNNEDIFYYPHYDSFINRTKTLNFNNDNKVILKVKKTKDYIVENNITNIDFLKIDTEGYELKIIKGFEDMLNIVQIIQFEYGGTYIDANIKLEEIILYLKSFGFENFCYLSSDKLIPIIDYTDHYNYCNIVCFNVKKTLSTLQL